MTKILPTLLILIVVIQVLLLAAVGWAVYLSQYYLDPAIEFNNVPFPVEKLVYHPGETVNIFIDVCRHTDLPSVVFAELRNSSVVPLPPYDRTGGRIGCYKIWSPIIKIPDDYSPSKNVSIYGKAQISVRDWIEPRVTTWHTQPFTVTAKMPPD